jgi:hypothetical protein
MLSVSYLKVGSVKAYSEDGIMDYITSIQKIGTTSN